MATWDKQKLVRHNDKLVITKIYVLFKALVEIHIPAGSFDKFKWLLPGLEDKYVES